MSESSRKLKQAPILEYSTLMSNANRWLDQKLGELKRLLINYISQRMSAYDLKCEIVWESQ